MDEWWRRRESNPRPKVSLRGVYVRSLSFGDSPPADASDRLRWVARWLLYSPQWRRRPLAQDLLI